MQIATWNVNSIRSRVEHVVDWLKAHPVDALCLQETKVIDKDFPSSPFRELGYHAVISGQKSYNGVAILSRQPLAEVNAGFEPVVGTELAGDLDEQKRVLSGILDDVRIVNLYVPNGASVGCDKYDYKLRWLYVLRAYLLELQGRSPVNICACGDFNIAPEDRDIHDPVGKDTHIMASPAEREALQAIAALGFADAFRKFVSETGHFSWWDYRTRGFRNNRGWRIDHHWVSAGLYERATSCAIDSTPRGLPKPSDHAPVVFTA
ncbi:exodeoxyribonuclease III [Rubidibacter lacunae KORDI 51-2]|uniref:Exodeoxyribonuclease III n=1 Tax=Rubidibacter lacunae KORDI 51-2 TaxID=582515 RepID=U5DKY3_9CHRO|nr:exodeoxyribonuclease III [Rubidibacter lacunae]ERN42346.1 exodeoxyribonuclease III [Rubidibacter lacunae KORDI 51-2]